MKRPALVLAATLAAALTISSCSLDNPTGPKVTPRSLSEARAEINGKKEPVEDTQKPKQTEENQTKEPRIDEYGVDLSIFQPTDRKGLYTTDRKDIPRPMPPAAMQHPLPPKERTTNSLQGAKDTAAYFAFMTAPAVNTADTSILEDLCSEDSAWCTEFTKRINDLKIVGSWNSDYIVDTVQIDDAKELKGNPRADVEVIISVETRGYKFYDAQLKTLEVFAPTVLHQRITLKYDEWRWLIVDVGKA